MIRRVLHLALSAAIALAGPVSAEKRTGWGPVIKGPMARNLVNCVTFRGFDDDTIMILQLDRETNQRGEILVKLINQAWSIRPTDDLPELTFRDLNGSGLQGVPVAVDHGLVFHIAIEPLITWADTLGGEPIVLMRDDQPLARLDSVGLAQAIRSIRACGRTAFPL